MFFLFISKTFSCLIEFESELKIRWEKKESLLWFKGGKGKKKKFFWYYTINVKQERKQRQTEYTH